MASSSVSEMGWSRVADATQVVAPGDEIVVKVLRVEKDGQQIALGLKQLTADPWSVVKATYEVGQVRAGRVTRLADFGAFVELEPGIEGLAHASTFPPTGRPGAWSNAVPVGTTAAFEVLSVDPAQKRIGLALVEPGSSRAAGAIAGDGCYHYPGLRRAHIPATGARRQGYRPRDLYESVPELREAIDLVDQGFFTRPFALVSGGRRDVALDMGVGP